MIDVFAALSLVSAAAKTENAGQLFADAEKVYSIYTELKAGAVTIEQLAANGGLKPLVQAVSRIAVVANALIEDPAQTKNIADLLSSL